MSQLKLPAMSFFFFYAARRMMPILRPQIMRIVPTHNDKGVLMSDTEREERACKIEKHMYDGMFFLLSACFAYYFCIGQDWLPWYLGGNGDLHKHLNTSSLPFQKLDSRMPAVGFWMLGFRFEQFYTTLRAERQTDFLEMLLHDILTI